MRREEDEERKKEKVADFGFSRLGDEAAARVKKKGAYVRKARSGDTELVFYFVRICPSSTKIHGTKQLKKK
jgi:hypothetical protein